VPPHCRFHATTTKRLASLLFGADAYSPSTPTWAWRSSRTFAEQRSTPDSCRAHSGITYRSQTAPRKPLGLGLHPHPSRFITGVASGTDLARLSLWRSLRHSFVGAHREAARRLTGSLTTERSYALLGLESLSPRRYSVTPGGPSPTLASCL
jgi:hypothetical protein